MFKRILFLLLFLCLSLLTYVAYCFNLIPQKSYTANDFNITPWLSPVDFNHNGIDDASDFVLGARKDAENHPTYNGTYVAGGYPTDDVGVCSDVIWRAFKEAGYSLKDMIEEDILNHHEEYPEAEIIDPNIDFRRVKNLHVFFDRYAIKLTTDINQIQEWQPGDIVIFGDNTHIGIVSDQRNASGQTYVIHNAGQPVREEDYFKRSEVTAHYRFDASQIDQNILKAW